MYPRGGNYPVSYPTYVPNYQPSYGPSYPQPSMGPLYPGPNTMWDPSQAQQDLQPNMQVPYYQPGKPIGYTHVQQPVQPVQPVQSVQPTV